MTTQTVNIDELFSTADIDDDARDVLFSSNMAEDMVAAQGISVDDVEASEVVIVSLLIDDSTSIRYGSGGNLEQVVCDGHNMVIDALQKAKQKDGILVQCRYLNGPQLYPFVTVDDAIKMDGSNYTTGGNTPLYDQSITTLGAAVAKVEDFAQNGVPARSVTFFITDGEDVGSRKNVKDVRAVVDSMMRSENHIVGALGIGNETFFDNIFEMMGIPEQWRLTTTADESSVRQTFRMVSQSALQASQGSGSFSKAAAGGFAG